MTYFQAYLFTRLDSIQSILIFYIFAMCMITFISYLLVATAYYDRDENYERLSIFMKRFAVPSVVISTLLLAATPTTKQAAFIYITPSIVNNVDLQNTIKQIPGISSLGLEYLADIMKEKKGK